MTLLSDKVKYPGVYNITSDYGSLETDSDGEVDTEHESNLTCGTFDPEDDIMDQSLLWDTEVVS